MQSYLEEERQSAEYNWLVQSKSPYLKQHETNPVNWLEWSPEAFEKARREGKPVFLSIGYSTCHWCHVMAHESFEDEEVGRILNEKFIAIKVDREERPDIDHIYMSACQAMTGQGGWPLSAFLTADQVPFYVGTYFPKENKYGRPGFKDVITQLHDKFKQDPEMITSVGSQITDALQNGRKSQADSKLSIATLHKCYQQLDSTFDEVNGGFRQAPKFPTPHVLTFLLRYYKLTGNARALEMVEYTLTGMANGGIYDHIGLGFSRYSVDEIWLVPHFEKMLYDNALLATAYIEAFQVTKNQRYKDVATEIFTYVLRDMHHSEGGFYSAEDADSEGVEGKFYVWRPEEIIEVLGKEQGTLYCNVYDVTKQGNFEGENIPNLIKVPITAFASNHDLDEAELREQLEAARQKLFDHREKRIHPHKDDKILTSWNGLMIAALSKGARALNQPIYLEKAEQAMVFIEENLVVEGRFMVRYRDGEVKTAAFIEDYANILWGYLELYESSLKIAYLEKAKQLAQNMIELFWDKDEFGFYFYGEDNETLLVRPKELYDGAIPSGNSVAALQLLRLARLTGESEFEDKVASMFEAFGNDIDLHPSSYTYFIQAYLLTQMKTKEVVILTKDTATEKNDLLKKLAEEFYPEIFALVVDDQSKLEKIAPFTKGYEQIEGATTYYLCENFTCLRPTTEVQTVFENL